MMDDIDLLSDEEEASVFEQMKELTGYTNVAFWSCRKTSYNSGVINNT